MTGDGPDADDNGFLHLRIAEQEDRLAAQAVFDEAFAPLVDALGYRPSPLDRGFDAALEAHLGIAADWRYTNGESRPVGFAMLSVSPTQLYVEALGVRPAYQGHGVGRALLVRAEQLASELCVDCVRLDTDPALDRQVRFYLSCGYAPIRDFAAGMGRRLRFSKPVTTALERLLALDPD